MRCAVFIGAVVALIGGCADDKPTAIAVAIATDFEIPKQLDAISITVRQGDAAKGTLLYSLDEKTPGHIGLPGTLVLNANVGENLSENVYIRIDGTLASALVVTRQASLKFVANRVVLLTLELLKSCTEPTSCVSEQTCTARGCASIAVDPHSLPEYTGGSVPQPHTDAGLAPDGPNTDGPNTDGPNTDGPSGCVHPVVQKKCSKGWCTIPAGCFTLGSPADELCRDDGEVPHQVTLTHSFEMQESEVTQKDYLALMGVNPSTAPDQECGPNCPVTELSSAGAVQYCNALSTAAGLANCYSCSDKNHCEVATDYDQWAQLTIYDCPGYRLPTEAEWEYAYRAGTTTAFYFGQISSCSTDPAVEAAAWYRVNTTTLKEVKLFAANPWGLFDLAGNIDERVHDYYKSDYLTPSATDPVGSYTGTSRRTRGGSYDSSPKALRAASRGAGIYPAGVRCVRTLATP